MQNPIPIPTPLSLGDLLDRAFRLYRARFGSMTLTAAVWLIPFSIISALLTGTVMSDYFALLQVMTTTPNADPNELLSQFSSSIPQFILVIFVIVILGMIVQGAVTLALTRQSISILQDERLTVGESIRQGLSRFWPFVGMIIAQAIAIFLVTLVMIMIVVVAVMLIAFVGVAGGMSGLFDGAGDAAGIAAGIGFAFLFMCAYLLMILLMLVPTIYLSARWVVAIPGLVEQEWGPIEALRRSWALTTGNVWRCLFYTTLLYILSIVIVGVPVYILQFGAIMMPPAYLGLTTGVISGVSSLFSVIWQPFYMAAIVLLYYDLRVRQEGFDLVQRIDRLDAAQEIE